MNIIEISSSFKHLKSIAPAAAVAALVLTGCDGADDVSATATPTPEVSTVYVTVEPTPSPEPTRDLTPSPKVSQAPEPAIIPDETGLAILDTKSLSPEEAPCQHVSQDYVPEFNDEGFVFDCNHVKVPVTYGDIGMNGEGNELILVDGRTLVDDSVIKLWYVERVSPTEYRLLVSNGPRAYLYTTKGDESAVEQVVQNDHIKVNPVTGQVLVSDALAAQIH